jgi:hypothetical protein
MALPIKEIYIDTRCKSSSSISNSNFKIDLPQSSEHSDAYIDDVCIPHSWYVIESDINDKLYIYTVDSGFLSNSYDIVTIGSGNYNGIDLAIELTNKINFVVNPSGITDMYVVTYSIKENTITIDNQYNNYKFKI